MNEKKKGQNKGQFLMCLCFMVIGGICGVWISKGLDYILREDMSVSMKLVIGFMTLLIVYISIFLHLIIHEAGHLVFGLCTGYRFSSFRIGNWMLLRSKEKLRFCRMSVAGTGGQCLMCPPDLKDGKMPFVLYNLGGSFMNLIFVFLLFGIRLLLAEYSYLSLSMELMIITGTGVALMNGIPMRFGSIDNDGFNTISAHKSKQALYAFWLQMKMNEMMADGKRLKDMPEEWFFMPSNEELQNNMNAALAVFYENRQMDEHRFEEVIRITDKLCFTKTATIGLHKFMLICDRIYCELIGDGDGDKKKIHDLLTKEQKAFMKQMSKFPTVLRTRYSLALLDEKDVSKADRIKEEFEMCVASYPYSGDIESERELMQVAEDVSAAESVVKKPVDEVK